MVIELIGGRPRYAFFGMRRNLSDYLYGYTFLCAHPLAFLNEICMRG